MNKLQKLTEMAFKKFMPPRAPFHFKNVSHTSNTYDFLRLMIRPSANGNLKIKEMFLNCLKIQGYTKSLSVLLAITGNFSKKKIQSRISIRILKTVPHFQNHTNQH